MKGKPTAVLYDLDSTLCDTRHRWHLVPTANPNSDWHQYAAACSGDSVIRGVASSMELNWPHHEIHICSMRPDSARAVTEEWLARHGICYDYLFLAPDAPEFPTRAEATAYCGEVKATYATLLRTQGTEPVLFYEDQTEVGRIIQERAGVTAVIVKPPYPEGNSEWRGDGDSARQPTSQADSVTLWQHIASLLAWLDSANPRTDHETAMRIMKVTEEAGEAAAAYIGMTGQNPRKGVYATADDLMTELGDVAVTALVALATVAGSADGAEKHVREYLERRTRRLLERIDRTAEE